VKILLTGVAGFIGSHLAARLAARGDEIIGVENFDETLYPRPLHERNLKLVASQVRFHEGDLLDAPLMEKLVADKPDVVVHLAALAGVRPSIDDPSRYADVNVTGTQNILNACREHGVARLAFASSSSVYGLDSQVPFRESDGCLHPVSPYAATKRAGELINFTAHHLTGLGVTNLRFFTVYGPRQRPDLAIHKFTRLISEGKPIDLFGDGSTSRDYTWVDDIIDGCVATIDQLASDAKGEYRTYNLGGSQTTTLRGLVDLIAGALGIEPQINWRPEQPGDMKRTLADVTLSGRALGYRPKMPIADGIPRFVAWYRGLARG